MNKVRYITPVFNFYFEEQGKPLTHTLSYKGLSYNIIFEEIPHWPKSDELVSGMDQRTHEQYRSITELNNMFGRKDADCRAIISTESENQIDETIYLVNLTFLTAIGLHSSNGVLYDSILITEIINDIPNSMISPVIRKQALEKIMAECSVLKASDFNDCMKTFEILLNENYKSNKTFTNILKLTLNYHSLLYQNWHPPTRFLLLMVIFEALFKKDENTKISEAVIVFAKLVEPDSEKREVIIKDFWNEEDRSDIKSFSVLRNKIAHGDPNFTVEMLAGRYKILYKYVVQGLIKVLHITNEQICVDDNYYDKLKIISDGR